MGRVVRVSIQGTEAADNKGTSVVAEAEGIIMTPQDYEKAMLVTATWRLARSNDPNELAAIICTIRNHIFPRPGQIQTYKSFSEACEDLLRVYPVRESPKMDESALVSYPDGLLAIVDDVYSCRYPDLTATTTTPGARYFGRASEVAADPTHWLYPIVTGRQPIGTFGSQQFF